MRRGRVKARGSRDYARLRELEKKSSREVLIGFAVFMVIGVAGVSMAWLPDFGPVILALLALVGIIAFATLAFRAAIRADIRLRASEARFKTAVRSAVTSIEETLPGAVPAQASLEDEIAEVSASLAATVRRLRQISDKAEKFEAEVRALAARAESARATAKLHEDDARKIALLLGSETETRLRQEIDKLAAEHAQQIESLRSASGRGTLWGFVGGVVLGWVGNVLVALIMG